MIIKPASKICNFTIEVKMRKRNRRNPKTKEVEVHVERLLRLRNTNGEATNFVRILAEDLASPGKFRIWLLERGNFSWAGGEKELQFLHRQMAGDYPITAGAPSSGDLLITGVRGIGKSVLAENLKLGLQAQGLTVLVIDVNEAGEYMLGGHTPKFGKADIHIFTAVDLAAFQRARFDKKKICLTHFITLSGIKL